MVEQNPASKELRNDEVVRIEQEVLLWREGEQEDSERKESKKGYLPVSQCTKRSQRWGHLYHLPVETTGYENQESMC